MIELNKLDDSILANVNGGSNDDASHRGEIISKYDKDNLIGRDVIVYGYTFMCFTATYAGRVVSVYEKEDFYGGSTTHLLMIDDTGASRDLNPITIWAYLSEGSGGTGGW